MTTAWEPRVCRYLAGGVQRSVAMRNRFWVPIALDASVVSYHVCYVRGTGVDTGLLSDIGFRCVKDRKELESVMDRRPNWYAG
ncbi:MAG: hypothetical protein U0746_04155 [Gemmataceae bacterium]